MTKQEQVLRKKVDTVWKNFGENSEELKSLWSKIHEIDKSNTAQLRAIVERYGWPGQSLVGPEGTRAAFLILQHSNLDSTIQKEYLPLLIKAAENNDFPWQYVAYLKDRILVYQEGKEQLYGTQVFFNDSTQLWQAFPIEDEANIDKRRAEVGLFSLEEYLKIYNK